MGLTIALGFAAPALAFPVPSGEVNQLALTPHLSFFFEPAGPISIGEARGQFMAGNFSPMPPEKHSFGYGPKRFGLPLS